MSEPEIISFGCRLNTYESEVIRGHARAAGLTDTVIVNSCAVTAEAERQTRQAIRRARRRRPDARIIVTGCAAQIDPDRYASMAEVDQILGNEEKLRADSYATAGGPGVRVNDIMTVREVAPHPVARFEGRTRAFVQIQQGCDHRCTFCVIPFARGPNRSLPLGDIMEQVHGLVANGYREIVLTGVDITHYGADLPGRPSLGQAVRRILALVPDLPRLRLSSLDPVEVDDALFEQIAIEPRLMPHFHISAQSGDDLILKRMKRRHRRADIVEFCARVRAVRPDAVFGADLIAGFPTETEAMFENTLALVAECDLSLLHVFPYSARPGTPAARMPQVPGDVGRARAAALRGAGDRQLAHFLDRRVGVEVRVLVESGSRGRCEHFAQVDLDRELAPGAIVRAIVQDHDGATLKARVVA